MLGFYHPHLDAKVVPTEALFVLDNGQSRGGGDRGHPFEGVGLYERENCYTPTTPPGGRGPRASEWGERGHRVNE
jgi:hypothetical protein